MRNDTNYKMKRGKRMKIYKRGQWKEKKRKEYTGKKKRRSQENSDKNEERSAALFSRNIFLALGKRQTKS